MANQTQDTDDLESGDMNQGASEDEVKLLEGGDPAEKVEEHEEEDEPEEASVKRDTELEEASSDEAREKIRERRRAERKNKQQRAREKIETLERQVQTVLAQNQSLAHQLSGIQSSTLNQSMAALDQEMAKAKQAADHFKNIAADAIAKQDGKTWKEASERAEFASNRVAQLSALKENVTQGMQRQQTQAPPASPIVAKKATEFTQKHSWYGGPQSSDLDSRVLTQLDVDLTNAGWDPTSDAYWQELDARIGKYLPHRAPRQAASDDEGDGGRRAPKQPVAGAGGSQATQKTGGEGYHLSAQRVQALKEAGLWNDAKKRASAIERFRKYDQDHAKR